MARELTGRGTSSILGSNMPELQAAGQACSEAWRQPPILGGYWRLSKDGDPVGFLLARRHYSAWKNKRPKQRQFVGPGQKMVLMGSDGLAVFAWRKFIDDSGQVGVCCTIFRNEGPLLSSDLIHEAMLWAWGRWPGERLYTAVDPKAVASANPGYCFIRAGWSKCGVTKRGFLVFECVP